MEFPLCSRIRDAMQRHLSSTQNTYISTGQFGTRTHSLKYRGDCARLTQRKLEILCAIDKSSPRDEAEARTLCQREKKSSLSFEPGSIKCNFRARKCERSNHYTMTPSLNEREDAKSTPAYSSDLHFLGFIM